MGEAREGNNGEEESGISYPARLLMGFAQAPLTFCSGARGREGGEERGSRKVGGRGGEGEPKGGKRWKEGEGEGEEKESRKVEKGGRKRMGMGKGNGEPKVGKRRMRKGGEEETGSRKAERG